MEPAEFLHLLNTAASTWGRARQRTIVTLTNQLFSQRTWICTKLKQNRLEVTWPDYWIFWPTAELIGTVLTAYGGTFTALMYQSRKARKACKRAIFTVQSLMDTWALCTALWRLCFHDAESCWRSGYWTFLVHIVCDNFCVLFIFFYCQFFWVGLKAFNYWYCHRIKDIPVMPHTFSLLII